MTEQDKSLQIPQNQQLMNEDEWIEYIRPIQQQIEEIIEKYGDASREWVFTRPGAGGKFFDYVRDGFFEEILNEYFPDWNFLITHTGYIGQLIYVTGRLILNFKGVRRVFDDAGEDKVKLQDDGTMVPGAVKAAVTDCFKRCCHRALGAAENVYNKIDLERKANVQKVADVIKYIEEILGDPEPAISTDNFDKMQSAYEYFNDLELPTTEKGWEQLNITLKRFQILKEAVDAERRRD